MPADPLETGALVEAAALLEALVEALVDAALVEPGELVAGALGAALLPQAASRIPASRTPIAGRCRRGSLSRTLTVTPSSRLARI